MPLDPIANAPKDDESGDRILEGHQHASLLGRTFRASPIRRIQNIPILVAGDQRKFGGKVLARGGRPVPDHEGPRQVSPFRRSSSSVVNSRFRLERRRLLQIPEYDAAAAFPAQWCGQFETIMVEGGEAPYGRYAAVKYGRRFCVRHKEGRYAAVITRRFVRRHKAANGGRLVGTPDAFCSAMGADVGAAHCAADGERPSTGITPAPQSRLASANTCCWRQPAPGGRSRIPLRPAVMLGQEERRFVRSAAPWRRSASAIPSSAVAGSLSSTASEATRFEIAHGPRATGRVTATAGLADLANGDSGSHHVCAYPANRWSRPCGGSLPAAASFPGPCVTAQCSV